MKIGIIGSGNAAIISAIMSIHSCRSFQIRDPKITVFYDPNIPTEIVGQGTTLNVSDAIHRILDVDERPSNPVGITGKVGFLYRNWARDTDELLYKLGGNGMSYHYNPKLLRDHFLKSNLATFIEKNVTPEEIQSKFDLVFDCRGKSCNNWEEYDYLKSPVNCCLLGRNTNRDPSMIWTENIATPDGWCFRIPTLDGESYGYVFNKDITSIEDAKSNFKKMFDLETFHVIEFKNYKRKKLYLNDKVVLNGNRYFFLEPLESTATPMYALIANFAVRRLILKRSIDFIEKTCHEFLEEVHEWILWHYYYGSDYKTKFWFEAQKTSLSHKYSDMFKKRINFTMKRNKRTSINVDFPEEIGREFAFNDYFIWANANKKSPFSKWGFGEGM
jgi:hypothetical protein